jgi:hypothetical protein
MGQPQGISQEAVAMDENNANLEHVADFLGELLLVLELGSDGEVVIIYGLSESTDERRQQLEKTYALVKKYFSC